MVSATLVPVADAELEVVNAELVEDDAPGPWLPAVDPFTRPAGYAPDANPVALYLDSLDSAHSRRVMGQALDRMAAYLSSGTIAGKGCALAFPWHVLTYSEARRLRSWLRERYTAPSTSTCTSARSERSWPSAGCCGCSPPTPSASAMPRSAR